MLPDLLHKNLVVVFCGTAPSKVSAAEQAYYAMKGNSFYPTLAKTGITPRRFEPHECYEMHKLGIGFTDLNKIESGADSELSAEHFDVEGLRKKIDKYKPKILAFTSKTAASKFLGIKNTGKLSVGKHSYNKHTTIFVLPSTSGRATSHWKKFAFAWDDLAKEIKKHR